MPEGIPGAPPTLVAIIHRHGRWIAARLRARFPRDAEDLEQEVMLRMARHLPGMRSPGEAGVAALVARVVRSVIIDESRRRQAAPPADPEVAALEDRRPGLEEATELLEDSERARRLFAFLTEEQRRIFALRFDHGLGFKEIAEILGLPLGTVTGWYSRGLRFLKEELT